MKTPAVSDLLDDETLDVSGGRGPRQEAARVDFPGYVVTVVSGPDQGKSFHSSGGSQVVLGTAATADLVLSDRAVSRRHLRLGVHAPSGLLAEDLGSRNGTFFGGARLERGVLSERTRLRLGPDTEIEIVVQRAAKGPSDEEDAPVSFGSLVGRSQGIRQLFHKLMQVARSDSSVLLLGETGTGKEALAEALHKESRRKDGPFVVVDCGTLAEGLLGSELFGHVRGAFTGATDNRRGLIEAAHQGTLFLDEIGELPLSQQPHLLRVLEKREIRPVGGIRSHKVDIRVIAATHRDLRARVAEGTFRQDLYFRLAVVEAEVPPLRERTEDIPVLLGHFLAAHGRGDFQVSPALLTRLLSYSWPGNVRELRNVVQRCLSFSDAPYDLDLPTVEPDEAPANLLLDDTDHDVKASAAGLPFKEAKARLLDAFERDYLTQLLFRHGGNVSRAAQEAGIDRNHIHRLLKRHRLPVPRP